MFNFRDLIDLAIGSPESGHVNFYALHVLLSNMAQRLDMLDEAVDHDEYLMTNAKAQSSLIGRSSKYRLEAGANNVDPIEGVEEQVEVVDEEPSAPPVTEAEALSEALPPMGEEVPVEVNAPDEVAETAPVASPTGHTVLDGDTVSEMHTRQPSLIVSTQQEQDASPIMQTEQSLRHESYVDQRSLKSQQSHLETPKYMQLAGSITSMGNQMKLAIEQLNNVTHLLLDRKPDPERVKQLRELAIELHAVLRPDVEFSSWYSMEQLAEIENEVEAGEELDIPSSSSKEPIKVEEEAEQDLELDQHLCYTTERMLNELLELKSEFCAQTNKVNELAATLLKQDCQRIMNMVLQLQEQVRDMLLSNGSAREAFDALTIKVNTSWAEIVKIKKAVIDLDDLKIDKTEVQILLAEKVDFQQLQSKVSHEQLDTFKLKLEKQFCEVRSIMSNNEKNVLHIIDNLRDTLGLDTLELDLKDFRDMIERRVAMLAESLQRYMDMTNDDCAAAAGRVKVLQDLACLSCDTPCVMRTVEPSKVGKLPNATATTSLGPLVTYELGAIRKSGVMGYYRKDEFPHSTDAWLKGAKVAGMNNCVPRHAGGEHTMHTAEDHMQKVVLSKRNANVYK